MRYIIPLSLAMAVLALATACGGGGDEQPAPTQTAAFPTTQPAAEALAFLRGGDIWLIDADGSHERRLTNLGNVQTLSWVSATELDVTTGGEQPKHLLVALDGSANELPFPAGGTWSRDGTRYVVPVDQQIVVFNHDGSEAARLDVQPPVETGEKAQQCGGTVPESGQPDRLLFSRPAISPDNRLVAVAANCQSRGRGQPVQSGRAGPDGW